MGHRRISLRTRLNIMIVAVILAVSAGLVITGYRAHCSKVDEFYFERCEEAAVTASKNGGYMIADIWDAVSTNEFRQVRERAVAQNDEEIIREWMRSRPWSHRPTASLYDEYEALVKTYDETRRLFEEADIYIQYMQNGDTYTIVDPQESLFSIGSKEARLPEFS